ncbi:MAG: ADP-ribosylglycohydrolase family protein [Planktothrix sp.]|uniref:ADP-ribosylglycohydrolase family protein n=1 Tax=Planktothrix sp. TaxID=3088171 RepID=UPI0038D36472
MNQDSLESQFQGAVLGATIGYELGQRGKIGNARKSMSDLLSPNSSVQGGLVIAQGIQSLIQRQGFDPLDYWKPGETQTQISGIERFKSGSEWAWMGLPLGLFFHDNLSALQCLDWEGLEAETNIQDGVLAMAGAIAYILTPNLELDHLIPNLLPRLDPETPLTDQLEQVQALLQQKASLEIAIRQLTQKVKVSSSERFDSQFEAENWTAFALGLYCFLTTPQDYSLTVLRAGQTNYQPEITASIGGALCGAYQGLSGISAKWRLTLPEKPLWLEIDPKIENNSVESQSCESKLLQLTHDLFAVWSGVYRKQ